MTGNLVPMALIVGLLEAADDAESVDALLEELVASGRISGEQANSISARVRSGDRTALDQLWVQSYEEEGGADPRFAEDAGDGISYQGYGYQGYGERMGDIFGVDGQRVAHAIAHAHAGPYPAGRDIRGNGSGREEKGNYQPGKHPARPAAG